VAFRWYIIQAYSNFEKRVAEAIQKEADRKGLSSSFEEILVPTERFVEVKRGRKIESERKFFPGYVLIRADLTDDVFHLIKNTPRVAGFLGAESRPIPISDSEVKKILNQGGNEKDKPKSVISYEIGDSVRVVDGPFASFNGIVQDVEGERARLKVEVSIFGRATPVELEFSQVEKVSA